MQTETTIEGTDIGGWTKAERAEIKAAPFDRDVLRALVDYRFSKQEQRKAFGNQIGAIERATDTSVDPLALRILKADSARLEAKADATIKAMVENHRAGRWAVSVPGIAHTFAGVLLAHVDIHPWVCMGQRANKRLVKCCQSDPCTPQCHVGYVNTAGKLWRFAGVDPSSTWRKGERRPHCAILKTLTWQIGESFKKLGIWSCQTHGSIKSTVSSEPDADEPEKRRRVMRCSECGERMQHVPSDLIYARIYRQRKTQEIERNERGDFAAQALERLAKAKAGKWNISPLQRETWGAGKLQPIGLDMRAGRYAAKLFLSHFHYVLHEVVDGCPPPAPYIISIGGHADFIAPPGWPCE